MILLKGEIKKATLQNDSRFDFPIKVLKNLFFTWLHSK